MVNTGGMQTYDNDYVIIVLFVANMVNDGM